jgi:hypothetical protein
MARCAATCSWTYHTSLPHWTTSGNCGTGCTCPPHPNPNPLPPDGTTYWYHCQPTGHDQIELTQRITVELAEGDALSVFPSKEDLESSIRINEQAQGACVVEGQVFQIHNKVYVYLNFADELKVLKGDETSVEIEPIRIRLEMRDSQKPLS